MSAPGTRGYGWQGEFLKIAAVAPLYGELDAMRRLAGSMLDRARLGVVESPYRTVCEDRGFVLRDYTRHRAGPALLLVPAPIKAPYIWDLTRRGSVVRHCLDAGFQVFAVEWRAPTDEGANDGLAAYAGAMLARSVEATCKAARERRLFLAGHSLGGTLAAIFACLHPERLRGLVVLGAPLNFGPAIGAFGPLVAAAPLARDVAPIHGNIPGSLVSVLSAVAAPGTFGWSRLLDLALSAADSEALARCLAVERWTLDERPIAHRLFVDVWEKLFSENALMRGTLQVGKRRVRPGTLAAPLLAVVDEHCPIAPPAAMLPFVEAAGSVDKQVMRYRGDRGVSLRHVGMLIGPNAHRQLWPRIETWMRERSPSGRRDSRTRTSG